MIGKFSIIVIAVIIAGASSISGSSEAGNDKQQPTGLNIVISMIKPYFIPLSSVDAECPKEAKEQVDSLRPIAEDPFQCDKKKPGDKSCICSTMQLGADEYSDLSEGKTCAICKMAAMPTSGESLDKLKFKSFIIGNQIARFLGYSEEGNHRLIDPQVGLGKSIYTLVTIAKGLFGFMDESLKMKFAMSFFEAASMVMPNSYLQLMKGGGITDNNNDNDMYCSNILQDWALLVQANFDYTVINNCLQTGNRAGGEADVKCKNDGKRKTNEDICHDLYRYVKMLDLPKDMSPTGVPAYCGILTLKKAIENSDDTRK